MHGVLIRDRKELTEIERAADTAAGAAAMDLLQDVISAKKKKDFSTEYFSKTLELLKLNPELTMAWNYRREILLHSPSSLATELDLLNSVMVDLRMTKSYCLWSHRRWILNQLRVRSELTNYILDNEMRVVEKIHKLDSRNFHAWSFRKFLIDSHNVIVDDFEYSTKLIEADFSNYSAWYLRMHSGGVKDGMLEMELVWNAIFTEPNDQSAWQYHDWLLKKYPDNFEMHALDSQMLTELESVVDEKDKKYILLQYLWANPGDRQVRERLAKIDPMRMGYYLE